MSKRRTQTFGVWVENNEWEGERWRWYIPRKGNKEALAILEAVCLILEEDFDSDEFNFYETEMTMQEAERRVEELADDAVYRPAHNMIRALNFEKLEGFLEEFKAKQGEEDAYDLLTAPLYKGGIEDFAAEVN